MTRSTRGKTTKSLRLFVRGRELLTKLASGLARLKHGFKSSFQRDIGFENSFFPSFSLFIHIYSIYIIYNGML